VGDHLFVFNLFFCPFSLPSQFSLFCNRRPICQSHAPPRGFFIVSCVPERFVCKSALFFEREFLGRRLPLTTAPDRSRLRCRVCLLLVSWRCAPPACRIRMPNSCDVFLCLPPGYDSSAIPWLRPRTVSLLFPLALFRGHFATQDLSVGSFGVLCETSWSLFFFHLSDACPFAPPFAEAPPVLHM